MCKHTGLSMLALRKYLQNRLQMAGHENVTSGLILSGHCLHWLEWHDYKTAVDYSHELFLGPAVIKLVFNQIRHINLVHSLIAW